MAPFGGFEHNLQSRRIVDELEIKYPLFPGLNLSIEIRDGLMKHSTPGDHCQNSTRVMTSIEAQICNIADEIAYNNHDIDDGLRSTLLNENDITQNITLWREAKKRIKSEYASLNDIELKYLINSNLISRQVSDVVNSTTALITETGIQTLQDLQNLDRPVVRFSSDMAILNKEMRHYLFNQFYTHPTVYRMNRKGQEIINSLFNAFTSDEKLLPLEYQDRITKGKIKERVVADYIAGMTDTFAQREFEAIYQ
ncbi:hypothetical protein EB093_04115 [bacterium]|nr:hypothetical protein [bacterium]